MASINRKDNLADTIREINRRIRVLETAGRFKFPVYTTDPATPLNGEAWVNSTTGLAHIVVNGVTKTFTLT